jgi:hypothetical protein
MKQLGVQDARCVDFFEFGEKGFDGMLFLMNGIGMAGTLEGLEKVFRHAKRLLNPGGQILIESTDLIYMFEQEDGSYLIPAGDRYYGEVTYQLSYKNRKARPFAWLFVDPDNLEDYASRAGFKFELDWQGEALNYIARLSLK